MTMLDSMWSLWFEQYIPLFAGITALLVVIVLLIVWFSGKNYD